MSGFLWNALNDAELHRANAVDRQNKGRGGSAVTVHRTQRGIDLARGGIEQGAARVVAEMRCAWEHAKFSALADYAWAAYPDRHIPVDLLETF
jgi:hypothetical protein